MNVNWGPTENAVRRSHIRFMYKCIDKGGLTINTSTLTVTQEFP